MTPLYFRNGLIIAELKLFFWLPNSLKDSLNQNFGQILKLSSLDPTPTELEILPGWFNKVNIIKPTVTQNQTKSILHFSFWIQSDFNSVMIGVSSMSQFELTVWNNTVVKAWQFFKTQSDLLATFGWHGQWQPNPISLWQYWIFCIFNSASCLNRQSFTANKFMLH